MLIETPAEPENPGKDDEENDGVADAAIAAFYPLEFFKFYPAQIFIKFWYVDLGF